MTRAALLPRHEWAYLASVALDPCLTIDAPFSRRLTTAIVAPCFQTERSACLFPPNCDLRGSVALFAYGVLQSWAPEPGGAARCRKASRGRPSIGWGVLFSPSG